MSLFTIADLHLSEGVSKPMDIFGPRWQSHTEKLQKHWCDIVTSEDTVIIPGDISWGLTFEEALPDFQFIERLPGKKIIGKGNHDFWWSTVSKMKNSLKVAGISSIDFLYNNALETENSIICGTRGWFMEEKQQNTINETDFQKMISREAIRLENSLKQGLALKKDKEKQILVFLHFPLIYRSFSCDNLLEVLKNYPVRDVYFGHIHGDYTVSATTQYENINMHMISADYLNFVPLKIQ